MGGGGVTLEKKSAWAFGDSFSEQKEGDYADSAESEEKFPVKFVLKWVKCY